MPHLLRTSAWILGSVSLIAVATGGAACGDSDTATGGGGSGAGNPTTGGGGTGGTQAGGGGSAPAAKKVVVLFTSDEHSHLFGFSPENDDFPISTTKGSGKLVGGIARRAQVIREEREKAGNADKAVILVSAGDNQMGTLVHTAFQSDSIDYGNMKALGYDATTFGNHEFDFGPLALASAINTAKAGSGLPPIVASNVHFSGSDGDKPLADLFSDDATDDKPVHPYVVLEKLRGCNSCGTIKIGVLGYVGVDASHVAPNKGPVEFSEKGVAPKDQGSQKIVLPKLYADLQPVVDKLRNVEKVDLVVALAHGGIADSSTEKGIEAGDDYNVCKNVKGIDFIVSGHAHNPDPKPIEVVNTAHQNCLVLNGSSFGQHLGRVEFTIPEDRAESVTWDKASQALIPINDETFPEQAQATRVPKLVETLEKGTYLPALLEKVTGAPVTNDAAKAGDLYFFPLGKTTFDITDSKMRLYLSADAMLKAADVWGQTSGKTTDFALESAGVIRSILKAGKTGVISASDAFNVVPLGTSLTGDDSIGYSLVRAKVSLSEVKLVLEFALEKGATNNDYNLGTSGMKVEYDPSAPFLGRVKKISVSTDHSDLDGSYAVAYDASGPFPDPEPYYAVVTSSYIAQFAGDAGVALYQEDNNTQVTSLQDIRLLRSDSSEIKQVEAFMGYIYGLKATGLPALYDTTKPGHADRWVVSQ